MQEQHFEERRFRTWFIGIFLFFLVFYSVYRFGYSSIKPPGMIPNDYACFHRMAVRLKANEPIYRPTDASPFKYSPGFAFLFRHSFGAVEEKPSWQLWCAASAFFLSLGIFWFWCRGLIGLLPGTVKRVSRPKFLIALGIATMCGWHGFIEHYSYGQTDAILVSFYFGAVAFSLRRKTEPLSALLLALILLTKIQMGVLLAPFLLRRQWRLLAMAGAFLIFVTALPAASWGMPQFKEYFIHWMQTLGAQDSIFLTGNLNQSVASSIARLSSNRHWVGPLGIVNIGLGFIWFTAIALRQKRQWVRIKNPEAIIRLALATLMAYAILSPLSWRWLTFIWIPTGAILFSDAFGGLRASSKRATAAFRTLLVLFTLNGLLLQKFIAHFLGVQEVDELSWASLYCLGNILLFGASVISARDRLNYFKNEKVVSSSSSRDF